MKSPVLSYYVCLLISKSKLGFFQLGLLECSCYVWSPVLRVHSIRSWNVAKQQCVAALVWFKF